MQDDLVERVAAAIQQAFYEGGGYEGMARAAMAATREIDANILKRWNRIDADWLQQRAKDVTDA